MPQPILAHISPTISATTANVALIRSSGPIKCSARAGAQPHANLAIVAWCTR